MAQNYKLWVKYPPVANRDGWVNLPGDFDRGTHGTLWLNLDEDRWFAPADTQDSAKLATRYLKAASGILKSRGYNIELYDAAGSTLLGITNSELDKALSLGGTIATKWHGNALMGVSFTEVVFFSRPRTWADNDPADKFALILEEAGKGAGDEVLLLIKNLLLAIPAVYAVVICFIALGEIMPGAVAVVALAVLGITLVPRGGEYVAKLSEVGRVMNTTNLQSGNLQSAGAALREFLRMLIEDVITAKVAHSAPKNVRAVADRYGHQAPRVAELFRTKTPADYQKAAGTPEARKLADYAKSDLLTETQKHVAAEKGFRDMPSFAERPVEELFQWLERNGFRKTAEARFKNGRNDSFGGSEIWIRRSPDLARNGLIETVRVDAAGHEPKFRDGPKVAHRTGKEGSQPGRYKVEREQVDWGSVRHFHKEVLPAVRQPEYNSQFMNQAMKFRDDGFVCDPAKGNLNQQAHIRLKTPSPRGPAPASR